ncbi:circadian clock-controlled protein-like isoform X2 [Drosophila hydei]|uniref:Circadian clock-controlled protein-like isoform X2 n=1 Tax=Drosophila hydei TaxID=7224 RepID=A0A6J1L7C0_DROHY|nr:circadian clock-controlled protein-like isoform X2 [Drosophila hydei]
MQLRLVSNAFLIKTILFVYTWKAVSDALQLPGDIQKCYFGDDKCIAESTNQYLRKYGKGNIDLGLPPFDNLPIDDITLINSPGPLWISYKLKNQRLKGFENATITGITGFNRQPEMNKMIIELKIPSLVCHGDYELRGRGVILYTNSSGSTKSDLQNVRLKLNIKNFIEYRKNRRYLKVYGVSTQIELDRWILTADNLFKENTDLTLLLNRVINENWIEFWNEIEATILPVYTKSILNIVNNIIYNIPYDELFLTH